MILSDGDIVKELMYGGLKIIPKPSDECIQPCSVDLHLAQDLKTLDGKTIDIAQQSYKLKPKEFILASTVEYVEIPKHLCGQVEGRSSIARNGIMIHITSGFIDAGYNGNITLEVFNASEKEFELSWGLSICQIVFHSLSNECLRSYGDDGLNSKYQDSEGTVGSRL